VSREGRRAQSKPGRLIRQGSAVRAPLLSVQLEDRFGALRPLP
jgi:hypothetical protein